MGTGMEDRRRLREHSATGGHESAGPRVVAKARSRRRPRKRVAADGRENVGPRAAAGCGDYGRQWGVL